MKKIIIAISALGILLVGAYIATPKQKRLGDDYRLANQQTEDPVMPPLTNEVLENNINLFYFRSDDQKCLEPVPVPAPELDRRIKFQEITALNAMLTRAVPEGYKSAIVPGTSVNDFRITDGVATLDLGSFLTIGKGGCTYEARKAQITRTLSQFASLKSIKLMADGVETK